MMVSIHESNYEILYYKTTPRVVLVFTIEDRLLGVVSSFPGAPSLKGEI